MNDRKLKTNLILQSFYQVLIVLTPLLTSPYISRTLGATNLGIYSFTYGIVNYFTIFASLGTQNYGSRTIASCGEDRCARSKAFSEIISLQWSASIIAAFGYLIYIIIADVEYLGIALLQSLYIAVCFTKVDWVFFGLEEFKKTVGRNVLIKIVSISCIFIFVRSTDSLWIYVLIMAGGDLLGQILMYPTLKKYVDFKRPAVRDVLPHIKPNLALLVPAIAYSLNHVLDKTMIGILSDYTQNGYYYNVEKVINIPKGLITGIGVVMMPRISINVATGEKNKNKSYLIKFTYIIVFLSVGMAFGLSGISKDFIPFFFGSGYEACILLLSVMSFALIFMSLSDMLRMQYLIPNKREKIYALSMFIGAGVNIILNALLIPRYDAMGAVIATVVAEFLIFVIQFRTVDKNIQLHCDFFKSIIFVPCAIIMYMVIKLLSEIMLNCGDVLTLLCEILVGGAVYTLLSALFLYFINRSLLVDLLKAIKSMIIIKKRG